MLPFGLLRAACHARSVRVHRKRSRRFRTQSARTLGILAEFPEQVTISSFRTPAVTDGLRSLSDPAILRLAYKEMREWIRRISHYRGKLQPRHPAFPAASAAECGESDGRIAIDAPDIVYTPEDDT